MAVPSTWATNTIKQRTTFLVGLYFSVLVFLPMRRLVSAAYNANQMQSASKRAAFGAVAQSAYLTSISLARRAALLDTRFGLLLAWALVRYDFPGRKWLESIIDLPFRIPTSVAGLALLSVLGDEGPLAQTLGRRLAFSPRAVLIALCFVALPFPVRAMQPVLQELEPELEEAALSLGASPWAVFQQILFPAIRPAMVTGRALSFSRAVGEFGSVVMVASNLPLRDLVAPVLVFQSLEQYDTGAATLIGTVMLRMSLFLLILINLLAGQRTLRLFF